MSSIKRTTKLPGPVTSAYDLTGKRVSNGLNGYEQDQVNQLMRITMTNE